MTTPSHKEGVVCVGSCNYDLSCHMHGRFPQPGETIHGKSSSTCCGGKGSNQVLMTARLGAEAHIIGKIGADVFGQSIKETLEESGVDTRHLLETTDGTPTGTAQIWVDGEGQNMIVIIAGSNGALSPEDVRKVEEEHHVISKAKVLMCQLEIPHETTLEALRIAKEHDGVCSILNPAPAPEGGLDQEFLRLASIICPNETELAILTGMPVTNIKEIRLAAAKLLEMAGKDDTTILVTLGAQGALLLTAALEEDGGILIPSPPATSVVDTSGAGDCFLGSLAAFLSNDVPLQEAIKKACALASLSVGKAGTQTSYPWAKDLPPEMHLVSKQN